MSNPLQDDASDKMRSELRRKLRKFYRRASKYADQVIIQAYDQDVAANPEEVADAALAAACERYGIEESSRPEITSGT